MLSHSNQGIKDLLREAKDHKVILEKPDENGKLTYQMNYPPHVLEMVVKGTI